MYFRASIVGGRYAAAAGIALIAVLLNFVASVKTKKLPNVGTAFASLGKETVTHRAIETIAVGQRVQAYNPEVTTAERSLLSDPNWSDWYEVNLVVVGEEEAEVDAVLLRPYDWLISNLVVVSTPVPQAVSVDGQSTVPYQSVGPRDPICCALRESMNRLNAANRCVQGLVVELDLPELGVSGIGCVSAVQRCTGIVPGPGQVVTGTFKHSCAEVIDLLISDEDGTTQNELLGVTAGHAFWSFDRREFVAAGDLRKGERVQTYSGSTKRISSKLARPGPESVFNLEVYGEQTYFVGASGILVHNSCATGRSSDVLATPNRLENKLDAWHRYSGPLSMAEWSKKYDQLQINRLRGKWREDVSRWLGLGSKGSRLYTPVGDRIPDAVSGVILREIKDGYVSLDKFVRMQIGKDFFLQGRGFLPEWHFFGGASSRVLSKLQTFGIPFFLH